MDYVREMTRLKQCTSASQNAALTPRENSPPISVDEPRGAVSSGGSAWQLSIPTLPSHLPRHPTSDTPKNTLIESIESTVGLEKCPRLCHPPPRMGQNRQLDMQRPISRPSSLAFVPVVPSVPETLNPTWNFACYGSVTACYASCYGSTFCNSLIINKCYGVTAPPSQGTPPNHPSSTYSARMLNCLQQTYDDT